jgi:hypothetical protein
MRRRTLLVLLVVLLAAAGLAAVVVTATRQDAAGPVSEADASGAVAIPAPCLGVVFSTPVGRSIDLTVGRGPSPAGIATPRPSVDVIDLGGSAEMGALATTLAATIETCPGTLPVIAAGGVAELVVAATRASVEQRPLRLRSAAPSLDGVSADERARAAGVATADLLAEWGTREVLVMLEDDVRAWVAVIAHATPEVVPLLVPVRAPDQGSELTPELTPEPDRPDTEDPVRAALAALPPDVRVTVVASDEVAATTLNDRVADAGREVVAQRIITHASDRAEGSTGGRLDTHADSSSLWLVDPADSLRALVVAAAAGARGDTVLAIDPSDAHAVLAVADTIRAAAPQRLMLVGAGPIDDAAVAWHLDVALATDPLPWGGWLPLEGNRIVALYGTPGVPALGVLGQQDLDATIALVRETAEPYTADGLRVVPGFDVIATVASRSPEPQGDYSRRIPIATLRPLIERAREEGMIVFLDLQPGRTDFLTQAKEYEELLREPHVSLALDPEWRLGPNEVHLRRIGSVEAAEVQTVVDWLAELVRQERLPQKVLMLHQFTLSMLQDRDSIVIPPELIGVIHVDGQGQLAKKEGTYRFMTQERAEHWAWGWKQFLRIDRPLADPARVIDRDPVPVVVTYQ